MQSLIGNSKKEYTFIYRITGEKYIVYASDRIGALIELQKLTTYPAELGLYFISCVNKKD